jgi:hypothetical protein
MTDEQLAKLNAARDDMLSWHEIADRVSKMKPTSFISYHYNEDQSMEPPEIIWGEYIAKLTAWAQEGYEEARKKYAAL